VEELWKQTVPKTRARTPAGSFLTAPRSLTTHYKPEELAVWLLRPCSNPASRSMGGFSKPQLLCSPGEGKAPVGAMGGICPWGICKVRLDAFTR